MSPVWVTPIRPQIHRPFTLIVITYANTRNGTWRAIKNYLWCESALKPTNRSEFYSFAFYILFVEVATDAAETFKFHNTCILFTEKASGCLHSFGTLFAYWRQQQQLITLLSQFLSHFLLFKIHFSFLHFIHSLLQWHFIFLFCSTILISANSLAHLE